MWTLAFGRHEVELRTPGNCPFGQPMTSCVDVVIQLLGVPAGPEVILKPPRFFSKAAGVLVPAMEEAHVQRLICVTGHRGGRQPRPASGDGRGRSLVLTRPGRGDVLADHQRRAESAHAPLWSSGPDAF